MALYAIGDLHLSLTATSPWRCLDRPGKTIRSRIEASLERADGGGCAGSGGGHLLGH